MILINDLVKAQEAYEEAGSDLRAARKFRADVAECLGRVNLSSKFEDDVIELIDHEIQRLALAMRTIGVETQ